MISQSVTPIMSRPIQVGDGERAGLRSAKQAWTLARQLSSSTWRIHLDRARP